MSSKDVKVEKKQAKNDHKMYETQENDFPCSSFWKGETHQPQHQRTWNITCKQVFFRASAQVCNSIVNPLTSCKKLIMIPDNTYNAGHIYAITGNPCEPWTWTFAWELVFFLDSVTNPFTCCYTDN